MMLKNTGLEIRNDIDSHLIHLVKERLRIRKSLFIPVEYISEIILLAR